MAQQADDRAAETPPPAPRGSSPTPPQRPRFGLSPRWIVFFLALLAFNLFITSRAMEPESRVHVPYSPFFLQEVRTGNVEQITSKGTDIEGMFEKEVSFEDSEPTTRFRTEIPAFANTDELSRLLQANDVTINAEPLETGAPWWQTLLFGFGPVILLVVLLFWLFRRAGNVQNALGAFGRSRARRYEPSGDKVTFADVAGIEEAEDELREVVEAIVGVGAARVRDLFKNAKENAPAIVFVDELDAIGRSRTSGVAGFSGGNDERGQTLNQILTEMDGVDSATNV